MTTKKQLGFTLLELLITIAIIGILASIAYPSYQNSILKSRRTDAKASVMTAAGLQESYFSSNNSYSNVIADIGGNLSSEGYYSVAVTNTGCSSSINGVTLYSCFALTATAIDSQTADTGCTTLTLTHTGIKSPSNCW